MHKKHLEAWSYLAGCLSEYTRVNYSENSIEMMSGLLALFAKIFSWTSDFIRDFIDLVCGFRELFSLVVYRQRVRWQQVLANTSLLVAYNIRL